MTDHTKPPTDADAVELLAQVKDWRRQLRGCAGWMRQLESQVENPERRKRREAEATAAIKAAMDAAKLALPTNAHLCVCLTVPVDGEVALHVGTTLPASAAAAVFRTGAAQVARGNATERPCAAGG